MSSLQTSSLLTKTNTQTLFSKWFHDSFITFFSKFLLSLSVETKQEYKIVEKSSSVEKSQSLSERFEIPEFIPPVHGLELALKLKVL